METGAGHAQTEAEPLPECAMTGRAGQGSAAGIDGCRAGWFFVALDERGGLRHGLAARFDEAIEALRRTRLVLVDIPIGLPGAGRPARDCDVAARRAISPRGSTIFPAPSRAALDAPDYAGACAANGSAGANAVRYGTAADMARHVRGVLS